MISENGRSPVDPPDIFIYSPIKKRLLLIRMMYKKAGRGNRTPIIRLEV